jgi:hypothetical protein
MGKRARRVKGGNSGEVNLCREPACANGRIENTRQAYNLSVSVAFLL